MGAEVHDLPLADRLVNDIIREWLDTAFAVANCTVDPEFSEVERGKALAFDEMQYGRLNNYWYAVTPKIVDALRRAGKMEEAH